MPIKRKKFFAQPRDRGRLPSAGRFLMYMVLVGLCALFEQAWAEEPLRVLGYGAAGASVYITPSAVVAKTSGTEAEIGRNVFAKKYLRGCVPLEIMLRPGRYLVSVMLPREQTLRDASLAARNFVWDGYDYHALVGQQNNTWRYAHCYWLEKKAGCPAELQAVFTDKMALEEVLSFSCGPLATRYTGSEEDAVSALSEEKVPLMFHEDIVRGLKSGHKMFLQTEEVRFVIQTDGPANIRVLTALGQGPWAGHRLNVIPYE